MTTADIIAIVAIILTVCGGGFGLYSVFARRVENMSSRLLNLERDVERNCETITANKDRSRQIDTINVKIDTLTKGQDRNSTGIEDNRQRTDTLERSILALMSDMQIKMGENAQYMRLKFESLEEKLDGRGKQKPDNI